MSDREKRKIFHYDNQGFVLNDQHRISQEESYRNFRIIAPTGGGKTSSLIIPNILQCQDSMVVTDPSSEIYQATAGYKASQGYKILVFQPDDINHSCQYNPLKRCNSPMAYRKLARRIVGKVTSDKDAYWGNQAATLLYLVISAVKQMPAQEYANLGNVRWIINQSANQPDRAIDFMSSFLTDQAIIADLRAFFSQEPKMLSQHLSTTLTALELWLLPSVADLTANDSLDLEALRIGRAILYMNVKEQNIKEYSLLLNLLYSDCFDECYKSLNGFPLYFFMDEFANIGRIDNFESIITTLRKYNCSISIVLQDTDQLAALYGRNLESAIANGGVGSTIYFAGLGEKTCQSIENILGSETIYDTAYGGIDHRARTMASPLMRASDIRMLKQGEFILLSGNQRPAKFAAKHYKANKQLRAIADHPIGSYTPPTPHRPMAYLNIDEIDNSRIETAFLTAKAIDNLLPNNAWS